MGVLYYNGGDVLNANCPISFSIGNRSTGKSFYWKRYCMKQYFDKGRKFLYLRRNETDIDISKDTWYSDISCKFDPKYNVIAKGNRFLVTRLDDDGNTVTVGVCGYMMALSRAAKLKSVPLEDVDTVIFDEFIPEDLRYLRPSDPSYEPNRLLGIYMTIARGVGKVIRPEVKIICIANLVSMYNPYFSFFGIDLTHRKKQCNGAVYAENVINTSVSEEIRDTKFGALVEGTAYGQYALDSKPLYDHLGHIAKPPKGSRLFFQLYCNGWYQAHLSPSKRIYFVHGYDVTCNHNYKVTELKDEREIPYFRGDVAKATRRLLEADGIYYDTPRTKSVVQGLISPAGLM